MIDPAEQLRRLAESRAEAVGPFDPSELSGAAVAEPPGAEVITMERRWPLAVAAAFLAVVALGAGAFAAFGGRDHVPDETAADDARTVIDTTSTVLGEVVVPDLVGRGAADAIAELEDAGLEGDFTTLFVQADDDRLGTVTQQDTAAELVVPEGKRIELVVARLAASTVGHSPCDRPPYLEGDFDGDGGTDGVYPRWSDGRIAEIEVCTATGIRAVAEGLDLDRIERAEDVDLDGLDDLIATVDPERTSARVLSLVGDDLAPVSGTLETGPRPDGSHAWWGCTSFSSAEVERLATGSWTDRPDGGIDWRVDEIFVRDGALVPGTTDTGRMTADDAADGPPGRERCEPSGPRPACDSDNGVVLLGDVDGDGMLDAVAPRDDTICLGNGTVARIGAPAREAGTWFIDDIDGDGRDEVFLGTTTADTMDVRPWSVDETGIFTPAAAEGCCEQWVPTAAVDATSDARWFSCVPGSAGRPAEIVSGRFWVLPDDGLVQWTIEAGTGADAELRHELAVEDPAATDAWIPGNGCRGSLVDPATIDFDDDGVATPESITAFNAWIAADRDLDRRFVRLREALGIARAIAEADGPYREDVAESFIEVGGVHDDSAGALRWDYEFSDDGTELLAVTLRWSCAPDRGHTDFSTEPCP